MPLGIKNLKCVLSSTATTVEALSCCSLNRDEFIQTAVKVHHKENRITAAIMNPIFCVYRQLHTFHEFLHTLSYTKYIYRQENPAYYRGV
jgi:hypothetical protein